MWIMLDKEDGYVITAHCEGKGRVINLEHITFFPKITGPIPNSYLCCGPSLYCEIAVDRESSPAVDGQMIQVIWLSIESIRLLIDSVDSSSGMYAKGLTSSTAQV